MSADTRAQLVILITTILKIVGGILAAHGIVAIAGVPTDQTTLLSFVEPITGLIAAGAGFYWSVKQHQAGVAVAHEAAAVAYVAGSADDVKPQIDPNAPVVQAAARSAVASVR